MKRTRNRKRGREKRVLDTGCQWNCSGSHSLGMYPITSPAIYKPIRSSGPKIFQWPFLTQQYCELTQVATGARTRDEPSVGDHERRKVNLTTELFLLGRCCLGSTGRRQASELNTTHVWLTLWHRSSPIIRVKYTRIHTYTHTQL